MFDAVEVFSAFSKKLGVEYNIESTCAELEAMWPGLLQIFQKDVTYFDQPRMLFGTDLSKLDFGQIPEYWSDLHSCLIAGFLHGDLEKKVTKLYETAKTWWSSAEHPENAEIDKILNDDQTESKINELIEFLKETRLAKFAMEVFERLDITDIEDDIQKMTKLTPQEIAEIIKNQDHPLVKKIMQKFQNILKEHAQKGSFTQSMMIAEIENIKRKVVKLFGNVFEDMLGMKGGGTNSSEALMGNTPEARRQRMIARMQKKHAAKYGK